MRRLALLSTLIALAAAGPAVAAPRVDAALDECHTSAEALQRYAVIHAEMDAVPRTDRMGIRFDLFVREPGQARYRKVAGPGLGTWIKSEPGVNHRFIWTKQIANLSAPAQYRARVAFRWYDRRGETLEQAVRRTKACDQPDPRPDLEVGVLSAVDGPEPGLLRYLVPVRNDGRGDADAFRIAFGDELEVTLRGVEAGSVETVSVVASRCERDDTLRVEVDPDDAVSEADETDNVLRAACPATS